MRRVRDATRSGIQPPRDYLTSGTDSRQSARRIGAFAPRVGRELTMQRALITGITGQDGRYLSEFLASKGYQVFGLVHGQANPKVRLVQEENPRLELVEGDLRDLPSLIAAIEQVQPDE